MRVANPYIKYSIYDNYDTRVNIGCKYLYTHSNLVSPLTSTTFPSGREALGFLIKPSVFLITDDS